MSYSRGSMGYDTILLASASERADGPGNQGGIATIEADQAAQQTGGEG